MPTVTSKSDRPEALRLYLQAELVRRIQANPRYSMRAFARMLQVDPSLFSKVLRGKRPVSRVLFARVTERLGLTPEQCARLTDGSQSLKEEDQAASADADFLQMTSDHFHWISDWYHYAIYEMALIDDFDPSPRWISRRLGISPAQADAALQRLERLGLFGRDPRGRRIRLKREGMSTVGSPFTAAAFRNLQRQILEGALRALEEVPMEIRDQSSMTMAIDSRLIPQAKDQIKKFRRKLCALLESGSRRDEVYQLCISLYPVSRTAKKRSK